MISLKNISFSYDGSKCRNLENINLSISPGECILIVGRSGCGKTSLLRVINGLIPNFYSGELFGSVIACNMDIRTTPMYKIAEKIGMIYQNPSNQFFNVDTDSEIAFGIENLSYPRDEIIRRLKKTINDIQMEHLLGRSIFELSGGEKQKVAFGSIYAMNPEIYLLDEPSANLDMLCTIQLREQLKLLKGMRKTLVISEHRLNYLKDIADRVIYMNNGRIEKVFTSKEFFTLDKETARKMGLRTFKEDPIEFKVIKNNNTDTSAVFKVEALSAGYENNVVISNITFNANPGDIIAITGNNGVGKSTLAETLCGLKKTYNGRITWKGNSLNAKQLLKLSYMVMQDVDYQLFAESVEKECRYGLKNIKYEDISSVLKMLNLLHFKDKHPATLSGGQKQRLAVAVSLLCQKEILIFDEPTSGLDLESMLIVTKLIKSMADKGKIIFVVTHDREFIAEACTRIIHLEGKRMLHYIPYYQ